MSSIKRVNSVVYGDNLEVLKRFPDNSFSAVVTDPPYGLSKQPDMMEVLKHWLNGDDYEYRGGGFMGKKWDSFVPGPKVWEEVMRVMKPGAHILSFSGTRTYGLMETAMRIAGAEIRDKVDYFCDVTGSFDWVYGSGFPKSLNISKAIDKSGGGSLMHIEEQKKFAKQITEKRKDAGVSKKELASWFPQYKEVTKNWERIDSGFRIPTEIDYQVLVDKLGISEGWRDRVRSEDKRLKREGIKTDRTDDGTIIGLGHTGNEYETTTDIAKQYEGWGTALKPAHEPVAIVSKSDNEGNLPDPPQSEDGVPFKYQSKASKSERNKGVDIYWLDGNLISQEQYEFLEKQNEERKGLENFKKINVSKGNIHPTVKPIELCRYLVNMVKTPGDNLILDPWCGSGSILVACILEGCDFLGIDSDPMSVYISNARIKDARNG